MNPPIRGPRHLRGGWRAINDGTVDTVGSDHAPHARDKKLLPWPDCPAGLTGVQTMVPVMLNHVNAGRLSLARMVDLMCAGPARVYGVVGKGRLAAGYDADFTLVDMQRRRRIEESWIVSPCGWTPFAGMDITGWPVAVVVRGRTVMREDEVLGRRSDGWCGSGEPLSLRGRCGGDPATCQRHRVSGLLGAAILAIRP